MSADKTKPNETDSALWEAVEEAQELLLEGQYHEALYALRETVRKQPRNHYAYYYIGTALFELGRFDACADAYRAALRLSPTYLAARVGLSHALRIGGELQEARVHALKALEQSPDDSDALFALGLAQSSLGERKQAIATLEKFLESNPEFEISVEAQALLRKLREQEPDNDNDDDDDEDSN